jgi:putative ABC transport system ATP-binding protein
MDTLIELRDVAKTYLLGESRVPALRSVSLRLGAGEFAAVTGPSGSGKSTLLHLCGLLDSADGGSYRLAGQDAAGLSGRARTLLRREKIGFIFQGFHLVPVMTAFENVEYPLFLLGLPARGRRERAERMLDRVGLTEFRDHRPDRLSGGQRQRVAVARALVKEPLLVLADEPTANLDTDTATRVIDLMEELCEDLGSTFLIATHDGRMAERCRRVIRLVDGRVS